MCGCAPSCAYFFLFLFCYPPFQALIFKLLSKWNSKIHLLSFIHSQCYICFAYRFTHRYSICVYLCINRSSYGATHIHYLFPDFVHFYFIHTQKKHWLPNTQEHIEFEWMCAMKNNLCLTHHFHLFCMMKMNIYWLNWMSWHFHIWIDTVHIRVEGVFVWVFVRDLLILTCPFIRVLLFPIFNGLIK